MSSPVIRALQILFEWIFRSLGILFSFLWDILTFVFWRLVDVFCILCGLLALISIVRTYQTLKHQSKAKSLDSMRGYPCARYCLISPLAAKQYWTACWLTLSTSPHSLPS